MARHIVGVVGSCERHEIFEDYMTCAFFAYMLRGHPLHWYAKLSKKYIHSFHHLITEIGHAFNHFDHKSLNEEIMKLQKALDESLEQFYMHFHNLAYQFLEDKIDWELLNGRFNHLLYISENIQLLESFEPCSTYFGDGDVQS